MTATADGMDSSSQYNLWEERRLASGSTPLMFRGNRAPTPRRKVPAEDAPVAEFRNLTDSLLKFDNGEEAEDAKWKTRMLEEAELGVDVEELRSVDRQW